MAKSIANQVSPIQILGRAATLLRLLEEEGLPYDAWQIPIDNPAKRRLLVQYWRGMSVFTAAEAVEAPLPGPVYDARTVNELLLLSYIAEQINDFGPPPTALPGFLTFFDPGWDILHLRRFCKDRGRIFANLDWYEDEAFANGTERPQYRQIRLEAVADSFKKNFVEQQRLLPENEEVPSARAVCMGMVILFLLNGQRMFEHYYVRCSDKDSDGRRIFVGSFISGGLGVGSGQDDCRRGDGLGLASSVKF